MECGIGLCGHCQMGPFFVCRDGPVFAALRARRPLRTGGAVMTDGTASPAATRRRGEVRLLRRLPAHAPRPRGRAAADPRPLRRRRVPRGADDAIDGPVRHPLRRGLGEHRRAGEPRSSRCARGPGRSSPSAPARRPAASRRCATRPMSRRGAPASIRSPEWISSLATATPIADHVQVDAELRGCPIAPAPAARAAHRGAHRPPAAAAGGVGLPEPASAPATSACWSPTASRASVP